MTFRVGDPVVCIKLGDPLKMQKWAALGAKYPQINAVYVIRGILFHGGVETLLLEEIVNNIPCLDYEPGYSSSHFRPAVSPKSEISFTQGAPLDSEQWDNRRHPARVKELGASA